MIGTMKYHTAPYFNLDDLWRETAPGEMTHLHDMGEGVPLVFLHGSGTGVSAAANWWQTLPELSRTYRCVAPDILGFGATIPAQGATFGIREWGAHTLRVLDSLEIEKTWLVGNSLGGWIALQLAIEHPDRLLGVISMGTGGSAPTATLKAHAKPDISFEGMLTAFQRFVTDHGFLDEDMVRARQEVGAFELSSGRLDRVIEARERDRAALPLDFVKLAKLELPVLLIHGREDVVIPPSRTWDLANAIPTADAVILNRCGHWSQIERADAFNALVRNFVGGPWR